VPDFSGVLPAFKLLGSAGEVVADALDGVALVVVEGEEFEAVAQALAVADDGSDFDGIGSEWEGNFEGDDFAGFEAAGEGGADAVLTHFGGASPAGAELAGLKHFDLQADVDNETRETAGEGDLAGRSIGGDTGAGSGIGCASGGSFGLLVFTHADLYSCKSLVPPIFRSYPAKSVALRG
jgi:hypothetical protein